MDDPTRQDLVRIVEAARAGRAEAREELVRRFQDMAVGYAYAVLGDFHAAEDAAQDAFVAALSDLASLQAPAAFATWFRRVLYKHCDRQRRRRREAMPGPEAPEAIASPTPDPAQRLEEAELQDHLAAAIRRLPEEERMVTSLFYLGDYSHRQIAEFLEMPLTTVNNRLRAARRRLEKGLLKMAAQSMRGQAPSRNDHFLSLVSLRSAIGAGDVGRVRTLMEERPDLLRQHHSGRRPLDVAAIAGHPEIVQVLLDAGADPGFAHYGPRPEDQARALGHDAVVRVFERHRSRLGATDTAAALCHAIRDEDETTVEELLSTATPADLDGTDEDGYTPLQRAARVGRRDWATALLDRGAAVDPENHLVARPLVIALHWNARPDPEMAQLLLERGARYDLFAACSLGDLPAVRAMVAEAGYASPPAPDPPRPVHFSRPPAYPIAGAARGGHAEVVGYLLEHTDDDPGGAFGEDALSVALSAACHAGSATVVRLFLEAGASPDGPTRHLESDDSVLTKIGEPLYAAAGGGHVEICRLLLDAGAAPDVYLPATGKPIDAAYAHGHQGVIELLEAAGAIPRFDTLARLRPPGYLERIEGCIPLVRDEEPHLYLGRCARQGNPEVIALLLRHDPADPEQALGGAFQGPNGDHEDWMDKPAVVRLLVEHLVARGSDVPAAGSIRANTTLLHRLSVPAEPFGRHGCCGLAHLEPERRFEVADLLLQHGADLEARDETYGATPLTWAAGKGDRAMVEFLLEKGAAVEPEGTGPESTPAAWARRHGHEEIARRLEDAAPG